MFQLAALWLVTAAGLVSTVSAQTRTLPVPAKTVFKCNVGGNVIYSDEPCLGAQRVEIEPTRGVSKSSGKELTGQDVSVQKHRETFAEIIKPVTGMSPAQFETEVRRNNLPATAKSECEYLDTRIAQTESDERAATVERKAIIRYNLLSLRKRFRALTC